MQSSVANQAQSILESVHKSVHTSASKHGEYYVLYKIRVLTVPLYPTQSESSAASRAATLAKIKHFSPDFCENPILRYELAMMARTCTNNLRVVLSP